MPLTVVNSCSLRVAQLNLEIWSIIIFTIQRCSGFPLFRDMHVYHLHYMAFLRFLLLIFHGSCCLHLVKGLRSIVTKTSMPTVKSSIMSMPTVNSPIKCLELGSRAIQDVTPLQHGIELGYFLANFHPVNALTYSSFLQSIRFPKNLETNWTRG